MILIYFILIQIRFDPKYGFKILSKFIHIYKWLTQVDLRFAYLFKSIYIIFSLIFNIFICFSFIKILYIDM